MHTLTWTKSALQCYVNTTGLQVHTSTVTDRLGNGNRIQVHSWTITCIMALSFMFRVVQLKRDAFYERGTRYIPKGNGARNQFPIIDNLHHGSIIHVPRCTEYDANKGCRALSERRAIARGCCLTLRGGTPLDPMIQLYLSFDLFEHLPHIHNLESSSYLTASYLQNLSTKWAETTPCNYVVTVLLSS
jgi:hypothetical protein